MVDYNQQLYQLTSRTEIENHQKCERAYYFRKIYGGRGIVPSYGAIPLVTGSSIHLGVESMTTAMRDNKPVDVDGAVKTAIADYEGRVKGRMLSDTLSDAQQWVKSEQRALAAALIRVWHKVELPRLAAEYRVVQSEKSTAFSLSDELRIRFMGKVDAVLENLDSGEPYAYSLKSVKMWSPRSESSYSTDLQGLTESMSISEQRRIFNESLQPEILAIKRSYKEGRLTKEVAQEQLRLVVAKRLASVVMGVRFCFLVKGQRWPLYGPDGEKIGKWTDSPWLVGYYRESPSGMEFAHSDKTYKPENKSGYGKLGKGWVKFNTWDGNKIAKSIGGLKGWLELLASGEVQPDLPSPFDTHVITPTPRFPHREELDSTLIQIRSVAERIERNRRELLEYEVDTPEFYNALDRLFPQTRRNCYWPNDCDYLYACYKASRGQDLLDPTGPYEERTPHHDLEMAELLGEREEERE